MTYEDLMAKIKPALHYPDLCANCACGADFKEMYELNLHIEKANNAYIWALRKVLELHKPDNAGFCSECFGTPYVTYPCSTIQAIEKELA